MAPHLLVSITDHGLGHVGQTAPVVHALCDKLPELRLTIVSSIGEELLRHRIHVDFDYFASTGDFGLMMKTPLEVDVDRTCAAYRKLHAGWAQHLERLGDQLQAMRPDLILANVSYAVLAAATSRGIPAIAMSCLNWADLYDYYCGDKTGARSIHNQMLEAYDNAEYFLQANPTMPMPSLQRCRQVGVIAPIGNDHRATLVSRLRRSPREILVLASLGGSSHGIGMEHWAAPQGTRWIVPAAWEIQHPDAVVFESLGVAFEDVLRSCDVMVCKPGYGSFAAAACNDVPVLYIERTDWPEQPYLIEWLAEVGRCRRISLSQLRCGELTADIEALLRLPPRPKVRPIGTATVAGILAERLIGANLQAPISVDG